METTAAPRFEDEHINADFNERLLPPEQLEDAYIEAATIQAEESRLRAANMLAEKAISFGPAFLEKTHDWIDDNYQNETGDYQNYMHDITDETVRLGTEEGHDPMHATMNAAASLWRRQKLAREDAAYSIDQATQPSSDVDELYEEIRTAIDNLRTAKIARADIEEGIVEIAQEMAEAIEQDDANISTRDVLIVEKAAEIIQSDHLIDSGDELVKIASTMLETLDPQEVTKYHQVLEVAKEQDIPPLVALEEIELSSNAA